MKKRKIKLHPTSDYFSFGKTKTNQMKKEKEIGNEILLWALARWRGRHPRSAPTTKAY